MRILSEKVRLLLIFFYKNVSFEEIFEKSKVSFQLFFKSRIFYQQVLNLFISLNIKSIFYK